MAHWYSIEVFDGASAASMWSEAYGDVLVEAALSTGAVDWAWHRHSWGVVLEIEFPEEAAWEQFRSNLAVQTALDSVPDPMTGLIIYQGRGGSAGDVVPRRPRPLIGSGAASLPLPWSLDLDEPHFLTDLAGPMTPAVPALAGLPGRLRGLTGRRV